MKEALTKGRTPADPAVRWWWVGRRRPGRGAIAVAAVWTALGVVAAIQSVLISSSRGFPLSLSRALGWQLPQWWSWALLTPFIVAADRRARRTGAGPASVALLHLALGSLAILAHSAAVTLADLTFFGDQMAGTGFLSLIAVHLRERLQFEALAYFGVVVGWYAWDYAGRHARQALESAELEAELARSELRTLESQLQPHFLFNTLQAIATLTERDPNAARRALQLLAALLRRVLTASGRQLTSLGEELDFLNRYLELERLRFGDRLTVDVRADAALSDALVPTLILLPLVENALRHGLAPRPGPGHLMIRVEAMEAALSLVVEDDGAGFQPHANGDGLGLEMARSRLHHLYGEDALLEISAASSGIGCVARIRLPLERAPDADRRTDGQLVPDGSSG